VTPDPASGRVRPGEICDLIGWMRRLSDAGLHRADPAELSAFQHAKQELLARIESDDHSLGLAGTTADLARGHDDEQQSAKDGPAS
jgi:hypothetical protein